MTATDDNTPHVSRLFSYPVKGCSGVEPESLDIGPAGVAGDRRWMLVDDDGDFLSQREVPELAQFRAAPTDSGLHLQRRAIDGTPAADIAVERPVDGDPLEVHVWDDRQTVRTCEAGSAWFREQLDRPVRLVWMPEPVRATDEGSEDDVVAFHDAYPALIISEASLDGLNARLDDPIPMLRFRPTVVIGGVEAHAEDTPDRMTTGELEWEAAEPCTRCVVTTIDQETGTRRGPEPLRTLSTYRGGDDGVEFGMYYLV
ncbi:MAG: MOSC domain-containing protein, partial [Bradymonadaceae bacterium]